MFVTSRNTNIKILVTITQNTLYYQHTFFMHTGSLTIKMEGKELTACNEMSTIYHNQNIWVG